MVIKMGEVQSDFEPVILTTTSDDRSVLDTIASKLVDQKLAACVQISGPIISSFAWEGKVESSEEWQCVIKTSRHLMVQAETVILEEHNYDVPQLLAVDIIAGSEGYLQWMQDSLC